PSAAAICPLSLLDALPISAAALQTFVDGIADWEAKEPGAKQNMLLTLGLFNAPPGGSNKLPNVDFHVWMDRQMNVVANHPVLARSEEHTSELQSLRHLVCR